MNLKLGQGTIWFTGANIEDRRIGASHHEGGPRYPGPKEGTEHRARPIYGLWCRARHWDDRVESWSGRVVVGSGHGREQVVGSGLGRVVVGSGRGRLRSLSGRVMVGSCSGRVVVGSW